MMTTVVLTPAQVETQDQCLFGAGTVHVVHEYGTTTVAKVSKLRGSDWRAASNLSAHHFGVGHVPFVVTHRPPNIFVEDLYTTLASIVAIYQSNNWPIGWTKGDTEARH